MAKSRVHKFLDNGLGQFFWPSLVAHVVGDRTIVAEFASGNHTLTLRSNALRALAEKWPDRNTRELLTQHAVQDDHHSLRSAALRILAEKWPDKSTRELLAQRAVQDDNQLPRHTALRALVEKWPDPGTRDLLVQRAFQDDSEYLRSTALRGLAEKWPDQNTRDLLGQRAFQDDSEYLRGSGLSGEFNDFIWKLVAPILFPDDNDDSRHTAMQALAEKWPDQGTRDLLAQRMLEAPDKSERGAACSALGKMHSELGRILPTQGFDGREPYLDPLEPMPRKHLEKAAAKAGIRAEEIDAQLASLSSHLGFDVAVGGQKNATKG